MIRRGTTILTVATALCVATVATTANEAEAFSSLQLKCRETIAKRGAKLADTITKTLTGCHKKRSKGSLPGSTDCNDVTQADTKDKVAKAEDKLTSQVADKCAGNVPGDILFTGCPFPCDAQVAMITTMQDVSDCMICVLRDVGERMSGAAQSVPPAPLNDDDERCHSAIGKNQHKHFKTIIKERSKCQKADEKTGAEDTSNCALTDPKQKIQRARDKGSDAITENCADANLLVLDSCSNTNLSALVGCIFADSDDRGEEAFQAIYNLMAGGGPTTTMGTTTSTVTTTSTTTTLGATQDPQCPNRGQLVVHAGTTTTSCLTNADCSVGTCNAGIGLCQTATNLDTGWSGISHNSDINDLLTTSADLLCPGPAPVCGQCFVLGVRPDDGVCRCSNDNRTICDEPFQPDADDCGGNVCDCYLGAPLPLSAGNTPACVVNRLAVDASGTVNVDTGDSLLNVELRSVVFLGENILVPCPPCGGTCTAPAPEVGNTCGTSLDCDTSCTSNVDCVFGGTCPSGGGTCGDGVCDNFDITPSDGVRDGTCHLGDNAGESCDITGPNSTFPAPGGGGMSLDCFPGAGKNVSGGGLQITLQTTTGTSSLPAAAVDCGFPPFAPFLCPCGTCSTATTVGCTSNSDCPSAGICRATGLTGEGVPGLPNSCSDGVCTPAGGGKGECLANAPDGSCDGIVRANGTGFIKCTSNGDCGGGAIGIDAGACTISSTRPCFLDPITATGVADASFPIGVSAICIPPTSNAGINTVAGLPGPGLITNEGAATSICTDGVTVYTPGVGGCP